MTFAGCGCPPQMILDFFGPDLASTIIVKPVVPAEQMHELFGAHDIFLFPSLMEGQPTVVLEALASGMPVITTETCGMPDYIVDHINGLLIPPADSSAIEQAVLCLAQSLDLRQQLGRVAQQSMSGYTWERSAQALERLFRQAIDRKGPTPE